jgi:hypothetical protein
VGGAPVILVVIRDVNFGRIRPGKELGRREAVRHTTEAEFERRLGRPGRRGLGDHEQQHRQARDQSHGSLPDTAPVPVATDTYLPTAFAKLVRLPQRCDFIQ